MVNMPDIGAMLGSQIGPLVGYLWIVLQIAAGVAVLGMLYIWAGFNIKVMSREMTKNNRVMVKILRAKRVKGKILDHPKIQLFGTLGFGGKVISQPPASCIFPFKTMMGATTLYDFVVKDGIYFPIENAILGKRYQLTKAEAKTWAAAQDEDLKKFAAENDYMVYEDATAGELFYSIQNSGLEINRDFDAEQATLNDLIAAAEKYKNRKPGEVYMLYGVVILAILGGFVTVVYALYKAGQVTAAVNQGWALFNEFIQLAGQSKQGPG